MKHFTGVAAIFIHNQKVGAFRRNHGKYAGFYEFVGGKIEANESHAQALIRECSEELSVTVDLISYVDSIRYAYDDFIITLHAYHCKVNEYDIRLSVHDDVVWLSEHELTSVPWLDADYLLFDQIKSLLRRTY
jgi:8-oxo-dGTP diphosphatase